MSALLWALPCLPLGIGALLAAAGRRADRVAPGVAVGVAAAALALAVTAALRQPAVEAPLLHGVPLSLAVDGLSGLLVVTVTSVTLAVLLFSATDAGGTEDDPSRAGARFFGLMLLFAGSMLTAVTAVNLPVLLMGWEVMGATSWALIGYRWREGERVSAADTAFLTTRTADLGLYLASGAALAAGQNGSLTLQGTAGADEPWLSLATAGIVVAALGKSAQLPFSFWLSRAMEGPSAVSALLHSATMVAAGAYLLLRTGPLLHASGWGAEVVAWAGAATAVALGLVAVAQRELKQLLAASTCAQIGLMVLAAGAGTPGAGALQLAAHAAAKSLLFLVAGVWLAALGTQWLSGLLGAARSGRLVGALFTVAALSLAGLPPLSLWATKDLVLSGAWEDSRWLYAAALAAAVLAAVYSAKALWFVWHPVPRRLRRQRTGARRVSGVAVAPLALLAAGCLALTPLALPPLLDHLRRALSATGEPAPPAWEPLLTAALALLASAAVWAVGARPRPWSEGWLGTGAAGAAVGERPKGPKRSGWPRPGRWLELERAAHALLVTPVERAARAAAAVDDRVVDPAAEGAARAGVRLARWADRRVERAVDGAVGGVVAGSRALGRWARRPQSGQLHQHLAQAVAAFVALAVFTVLAALALS